MQAEIEVMNAVLESNAATGENKPPIKVTRGESSTMAHAVDLLDASNNPVATVSYIKGHDPEIKIVAPTGIHILTDPIEAESPRAVRHGVVLSVEGLKDGDE